MLPPIWYDQDILFSKTLKDYRIPCSPVHIHIILSFLYPVLTVLTLVWYNEKNMFARLIFIQHLCTLNKLIWCATALTPSSNGLLQSEYTALQLHSHSGPFLMNCYMDLITIRMQNEANEESDQRDSLENIIKQNRSIQYIFFPISLVQCHVL